MTKTDTILWLERIRESVRMLPDDADVYGFQMGYEYHSGKHKPYAELHITHPLDGLDVYVGKQYSGWHSEMKNLAAGCRAWWSVNDESSND